ncbi:HyuE hydantoin racemase [Epibacterium sp. SM1979]|uniref:HyuE hydantoin racemase n=1 Tax=Tritonibacter litoralis TaxID=2662264 RepID=A0A843YE23_9RHOB|nr:aspartate/glutamate racemase family protein [Tritonibacter litoralis]MQQ09650.1 HyuE hydantoin racemase [Tritonibacter litoralis]
MAVIIINPNSTAAMTTAMLEQAQRAAPEIQFEGWTSENGPPSIQGEEDGKAATKPLLELIDHASTAQADGIIIGCFDDTALTDAARRAACPVIGLGQASYHYAALRNWRFSVVTTLAVSVPILEDNITRQGLGSFVSKVRASDVPVLALDADPKAASQSIVAEAQRAEAEDAISAVVLGCAGMVHVAEEVARSVTVATIDPVVCAARCMAWIM